MSANSEQVTRIIKYLEGHNGRDKIVRLFQYGSRFLGWWLVINNKGDLSKRVSNLEQSSSMARKVFRLAKSISHVQQLLTALEKVILSHSTTEK
jgi:peroxin-11B